ncbi:amino acid permease [Streptomyces glebosus]|uniref:Amino acid permease n=1 Tax=Streptomyces glebosus TaxID=249580 RepID=A0A640SX18_9ACTN|nr:APC family permease [Streptomyces glebosus]GFE14616.1 amino acid permease [Streptomyces glebosus]GHG91370.1 amino acid permease [Streptomyces glebosus]
MPGTSGSGEGGAGDGAAGGGAGAGAPGGLRRTLTFRDLLVYGLLFIAPMAPVGIFGTLQARSHGAVTVVYLVATVAMACTASSYAHMVRVAPRAGSVYAYARAGLGEGAGFVAGWMAMLDYLLIPAVAYLFSGIALHALVPAVHPWVWTALAVVVTTLLNLAGVRTAARVGFAVLAMEIVVLAVFAVSAVVVLVAHGAQRGWAAPLTGEGGFSPGAVLSAVSVAVLSYLGFDAIASFAEEAGGGADRVARALLTCLVVAGVLFAVQTYLAALLMPMSAAELAARPAEQGTAFYTTVDSAVGGWLRVLVAVSKAVGAAFAALAGQAAAGRLLFAMARDRRLPGAMSKVDAASGAPRRALLGAALVTLVAAVGAARRDDGLDQLSSIVNVGALTAFGLLHASVLGWFWIRGRRGDRGRGRSRAPGDGAPSVLWHAVVPLLGLAVVIAVVVEASATAQLVGGVWLVAGLVVLAVQYGGRARAGGVRG